MHKALALALILTLSSCAEPNRYYDVRTSHHTPTGFKANYLPPRTDLTGAFLHWQWQRIWQKFPPDPPAQPIVGVSPQLAFLHQNTIQPSVTWIGHASMLVQVGGLNILTDPVFSERVSPLAFIGIGPKRLQAPGLTLAQLPHIDAVLISHDHYDHLDLASVRALYGQAGGPPQFFVPLGINDWLMANVTHHDDQHITALDWWQKIGFHGLDVQFLPVQHWGARGLSDRYRRLWGAWALYHPSFRFFFGGDFGWSQDLADIGQRTGGFDLAALPIGAYAPRWFMAPQHIAPEQAVQARQALRAEQAVAMHWGTFELSDEPADEPPLLLAKALQQTQHPSGSFWVMRHGETRVLEETGWRVVSANKRQF